MARYIPDINTTRWVIISPGRITRPSDHEGKKSDCPFCPRHESMTPPEFARIGEGEANGEGWYVRVIPNKFPIADIHEVIIHSPSDTATIQDFSEQHMEFLMRMYRDRYNANKDKGNVLIFSNYGERAGASLKHPHSQLVVVPRQITLDIIQREQVANVVESTELFNVFCPEFSQWPYEVWISPKHTGKTFGDTTDPELFALGSCLQKSIRKLGKLFPDFQYNYYIHHDTNWYLRIIPRLVHRAGFELGTGLSVNIKDPLEAARELTI